MSNTQCATEPALTVKAGASKLLKALMAGFAISVMAGLGLAIWYLGERIINR